MGPIDYSLNIANPLQSALQGYQLGQQVQEQQRQRQEAELQKQQAMLLQEDMAGLFRPGATFTDYQRVMQRHPQMAKQLLEQFSGMDKAKKGLLFDAAAKAYSLIKPTDSGGFDGTAAVSTLEEYAAAADNSGEKDVAQQFRDMAKFVKDNPSAGRATIGATMTGADPERAKAMMEATAGGGDVASLDKQYALNVKLFGKPQADAWRAAEEARKGVITATGPLGMSYVPSLKVAPMLAADDVASPPPSQESEPIAVRPNGDAAFLTPDQYKATVQAMGKEATDDYIKRNNIVVIQSKATAGGKTFYQINGKWYDNPEGR